MLIKNRQVQLKYQEQLANHLAAFYYYKGVIMKNLGRTRDALNSLQRALSVPLMSAEVNPMVVKAFQ